MQCRGVTHADACCRQTLEAVVESLVPVPPGLGVTKPSAGQLDRGVRKSAAGRSGWTGRQEWRLHGVW